VLLVGQFEQQVHRRRAELLLADVQSLELRKTSWKEAQIRIAKWGSNSKLDAPCDQHTCTLRISLDDWIYGIIFRPDMFTRLDDYLRWRFRLAYSEGPFMHVQKALLGLYVRAGAHPSRVVAIIGMRDGIVWNKGFWAIIATYARTDPGSVGAGYPLLASAETVPGFDAGSQVAPELALHPDYRIGSPSGCDTCIYGWTKYTPYADPADVHRLLQMDLSCLTRWLHPCLTQADIMPIPWSQHMADLSRIGEPDSQPACSPLLMEILGRDSPSIVTGQILAYRESGVSDGVQSGVVQRGVARVRALKRLKGVVDWNAGDIREVPVSSKWNSDLPQIRAGSQLILFDGSSPPQGMQIYMGQACPLLPLNEANLGFIKRGITQEYGPVPNMDGAAVPW
jgi:hypothetical protein